MTLGTLVSILNVTFRPNSVSAAEISEAVDEKSANNDEALDEAKGRCCPDFS